MGEISDAILDGELCQVCGEWLDEPSGFPSTCLACAAHEQSPGGGKQARIDQAERDFKQVALMASASGYTLKRCSPIHYQLRPRKPDGWLLNIYPSNGRVYSGTGKPPILGLGNRWTLQQVIDRVIQLEGSHA